MQLADDDCGNRIGGDRAEGCGVCLLGSENVEMLLIASLL